MGVVSKAYHSILKFRKHILNTLLIGICGTATSIAIAIPLDKIDYDIVISEDNYPLLFAKKNKYGFSEKISLTELNTLDDCNSSSGCSSEAVQKGANKYFMSSTGDYGLATAYYNSLGKLVGTHLGGIGPGADTTKPVITLPGANPLTLQRGSSTYSYNATAQDDVDGTVTVSHSGSVNINTIGIYTVTYTATDSAGNSAIKNHTVNVVGQSNTDTTAPVITITGGSPITIQKGSVYNDAGITAVDDGGGSVNITTTNNTVNTNQTGTYEVSYSASDTYGNQSIATRIVYVVDNNTPPNNTPPPIPTALSLPPVIVNNTTFPDSTANPVGYLDGEFAVSQSGAATYNVPIAIPPGTAGVQPNISLSYNSQSGVGIAGQGWSLSGLSSISRCPKTKAQDKVTGGVEMSATDVYCLDGQKLIKTYENLNVSEGGIIRRFKTETDNYSEIELIKKTGGNYFLVKTKAGEIHSYGFTDDSSIYLDYLPIVAPSNRRISFLLNQTKDLLGNYINYTYQNVGSFKGKIVRIDYTGNLKTRLAPYNSIHFSYGDSTQPYTGYIVGSNRYILTQLKKVSVRYNSSTIRDYNLSYLDVSNDITKVDKLKSIQECAGSKCLPATVFKWSGHYESKTSNANAPFSDTKNLPRSYEPNLNAYIPTDNGTKTFSTRGSSSDNYDPDHTQKFIGDVDGDGLTDIVSVIRPESSICGSSTACLQVESSTGPAGFHFPKITYGLPESNGSQSTSPFFLADVDGDGLSDLVNFTPYGKVIVYRSNGTKFSTGQVWRTPSQNLPTSYNLARSPILLQDVNGDGKADIVSFGSSGVYVSRSYASSFTTASLATNYFGSAYTGTGLYRQNYTNDNVSVQLIDVSSDGLPDIVVHNASGTMVALNTSSGYDYELASFEAQLDASGNPIVAGHPNLNTPTNKNTPRLMGDVNSDGYPDIVGFFENGVQIAYGIGKNSSKKLFESYQPVYMPNAWVTNSGWNYTDKPLYVVDVNADGRADIVALDDNGTSVRLANSYGFDTPTVWNSNKYNANNNWENDNSIRTFGDFNGDGLSDFIAMKGTAIAVGINNAKQHRISQIIIGGEVAYVSNIGMNRSIDVEYEKLTAPLEKSIYRKGSYSGSVQAPMFVVSAHFSSNGNSFNAAGSRNRKIGMLYQYEGLAFDRLNGRGSLGFKKRTTRDLSKNIYTEATFHQNYPLTGKLEKVETFLKTGSTSKRLSSKTITTKSKTIVSSLNNKLYYKVYIDKEVENIYDLNSSVNFQRNLTTFSEPSSCGNIGNTKVTNYDLVKNENYSKETIASYPGGSSCFQQSRLVSTRVYTQRNGSDQKTRYSTFTYNSNGQIQTETIEPQYTKKLKTTYTYDLYGNVRTTSVSGSDIATRTSTTNYDSKGRFATSTTNALNQTTTRQYDQKLGLVTSVTDINNLPTKMYYNAFAQKYLTVAPNNSYIYTIYNWNVEAIGNSNSRYLTQTLTSENEYVAKQYDQLDRVLRIKTDGLDGQRSIVDKQYNLQTADLEKESLPYLTNGSPQWVTYTYDELGRTKSVKKPGQNTSTLNYYGLRITATDQQSTSKVQTNNVLGKPLESVDDLGNKINYFYNSDGTLDRTQTRAFNGNTQDSAGGNYLLTTSFVYDNFGNKTQMIDPDMGTWNYTYYSTGELKTQTDSKGQAQSLFYDKLGRLISRSESSGTTSWQYDSALGKAKGKLASTNYNGIIKSLSYNDLGQLALVEEKISNGTGNQGSSTYFTQTIYDANGRIDRIKYPNLSGSSAASIDVRYEYSAGGKLKRIRNVQTSAKYWEANKSNAFGNITEETFGNGVKKYQTFDSLGRINFITSNKSNGAALQALDYDFDQVGNLVKRNNNLTQASETFNYDGLYRLKTAFTTYQNSTSADSLRYDGHGNITSKKGKYYRYDGNSKHAVSQVGSDYYTYDANGNMTAGAGRTISWNSFNKPSNISRGTQSIQLLYDGDRSRVYKETTDTSTNGINKKTWYVNGLFEREKITSGSNSGAETHKYYLKAGNQTVGYITQFISNTGVREASNTRYLLTDHLGSVDVITKADGNVAQTLSFDSWGNRRQGSWNPNTQLSSILAGINAQAMKMGFTGHEHDDEVGLVNMKGRLYDPEIGRFISADTYIQSPTDTQSYNRYTYVKNNPLSYTDPSGHFFWFIAIAAVAITAVGAPEYLRTVVALIATIATGGAAAGLYSGVYGSIVGGAVGGFVGGAISTGSLSGALRGAAFGALSAGLTSGIASGIPDGVSRSLAHGVAQGTISVLRGGKFGAGLISGFASHVAAPFIRGADKFVRTTKAAILGGTVSALVGGKFANGAISGAFVHLFNAETALEKKIKALEAEIKIDQKNLYGNGSNIYDEGGRSFIERADTNGDIYITRVDGGVETSSPILNVVGGFSIIKGIKLIGTRLSNPRALVFSVLANFNAQSGSTAITYAPVRAVITQVSTHQTVRSAITAGAVGATSVTSGEE